MCIIAVSLKYANVVHVALPKRERRQLSFHHCMLKNTVDIIHSEIFPDLQAAIRSGRSHKVSQEIHKLLATGKHLHIPQTEVQTFLASI